MNKLTIENSENYAAHYVTLKTLHEIPGANSIQHAVINGNLVIVSKESKVGDRGVFFPVESQLSGSFAAKNNLYSDQMLNADQTKKGYFGEKRRVRCIKFMKVPSEGLFCPLEYFEVWRGIKIAEWDNVADNQAFDTIDGEELCRKYLIREKQINGVAGKKVRKLPSRLIEGQYHLHYDTSKLADNIHLIDPDDYIVISDKFHGTSLNCGRVLLKRNLSWWEKIKNFCGLNVPLAQYENVYASRTVIKSLLPQSDHYYKEDVWRDGFKTIEHALTDGIQIYAEIVGYTPSGSKIQGKWTYGCKLGEFKVVVYRVTHTSPTNEVTEYSMREVIQFCRDNKLQHVPIFYQGLAKDLFPNLHLEAHWHEEFLKNLKTSFNLEQICKECNTGVPAEGICLRNETKGLKALKLKAFAFLCQESLLLDKGEVDIESDDTAELEEIS
jgi:hypothetical protein